MAEIRKWLKKKYDTFVDPEHDDRINYLVRYLRQHLQRDQRKFDLARVLESHVYQATDLQVAKEEIFREALARAWADGKLSITEKATSEWLESALEMAPSAAKAIRLDFARDVFSRTFADAMQDGILDEQEERQLEEVARSVDMSRFDFCRSFFKTEGEGFLRAIFHACIDDGKISQEEWNYLITTAAKFGLLHQEMLEVISTQAQQFVEHVLADAKSDNRLSVDEEVTLLWLIKNLSLPPQFLQYVQVEVDALRLRTDIQDGKLPTVLPPPGVEIKAGEIVHFLCSATCRQTRTLKSGPKVTDHEGFLMLTDSRLVFSSRTKSYTINYRRIVRHRETNGWIEIYVSGKPAFMFFLQKENVMAYLFLQTLVAMANQTKVSIAENTRHIPRDVRQRVWQRCQGQCVDCGSNMYLEFDHIIPVAKGGGNTDNNVQLLCRGCNQKKSDHI